MGSGGEDGTNTQVSWVQDEATSESPSGPPRERAPGEARDRIANRYGVLAQLGVGGMGTVYQVYDLELDEIVALKLLKPEFAARPWFVARFRDEVRLARRVTHPNVVRTYDLGEWAVEDGPARPFLTMQLVRGTTLARRLEEVGTLTPAALSPILQGLCAGLQAAHDVDVLHRDLKPDNVLLDEGGRAVISDFGIARAGGSVQEAAMGTPAYMAPEQAVPGARVDQRADLHAVGAIAYEALTGRRPPRGVDGAPPDPRAARPDLPDAVAAVVSRCLEPDPARRYGSARAVAEAWEDALARVALARTGRTAPPSAAPGALAALERPSAFAGSVAVLPFATAGDVDPALGRGLAEELVDVFSMTRGLRVRPLGAARLAAEVDARDVGRSLGVDAVVDGSLRRGSAGYRVTVRCASVADGFQLGAWRFHAADPLSLAEEAATAVAQALAVDLDVPDRPTATRPDAAELYLQGKNALRARASRALDLLGAAAALAPDDPRLLGEYATAVARADARGADALAARNARARTLADRAIEMAPERVEGWFVRAIAALTEGDAPGAALACRTVLLRMPGHLQAQDLLAMLLLEAGDLEGAHARVAAVLAADPGSVPGRVEAAYGAALAGRWEESLHHLERVRGDAAAALCWARLGLWSPAFPPVPEPATGDAALLAAVRAGALAGPALREALAVPPDFAGRRRLARLGCAVEALAWTGEPAEALAVLGEAVAGGLADLAWLDGCPLLAPLARDPAWAPLHATVAARAAEVRAAAHG